MTIKGRAKRNLEFYTIIKDIITHEAVKEMHNYRHHYDTSTFDHCLCVSYLSYLICKKLKLDYKSAARGAMIHDFFLYDWHIEFKPKHRFDFHATSHPRKALENANKIFVLNAKEKDIILKHMWPITFFNFPRYLESIIVLLVDKYCTICEGHRYYSKQKAKKKQLNSA